VLAAGFASAAEFADPKDQYFTTADGVKIHYITQGDKGSWVVLIHGFTDSAKRMFVGTGIISALATNHRVVAIAKRTYRRSPRCRSI
jgi:pimeloyl-ACP methyl ester carboxylesterase